VALIVLDASVVIAHLDARDAVHTQATDYLDSHAGDDLRLPASAYAEVLVEPARTGRSADLTEAVAKAGFRIEPITAQIAERAASLRAGRRPLRLPDALVVATGEVLDADAVVTADRRWRRFQRAHVIS
jgi:predicted nucleic acid-binding protein